MNNLEKIIAQADLCMDQKSYKKAILLYDHLIELQPDSARFYALRGLCYSMLNEHENALRNYSSALTLKPDVPSTLYQWARTYQRLGECDKALLDYQKSGDILPRHDVFFNMGMIYQHQNELEKARKCYRKALALNPDYQPLKNAMVALMRKIKKISGLRTVTLKSIKRFPDVAMDICRATQYINCGNCEDACSLYDSLVTRFPEHSWPYILRGCCFFYMADYEAALHDFSIASLREPDDASIWFNRAKSFASLKQYSEAIKDLHKSYEIMPGYDVWYFLGMIREDIYEFDLARTSYLKALQFNPQNRSVSAAINLLMKRIKLTSGLRMLKNRLIKMDEKVRKTVIEANRLIQNGKCESAILLYDSLIIQLPEAAWAHRMRGCCFYFMGNYEDALKDFSFELTMHEDNADALFNRAQAYSALEDFDKALEDFRKSGDIQPNLDIVYNIRQICTYCKKTKSMAVGNLENSDDEQQE